MPKFNLTIGGTQIPQYCTILPAKYDEHIDEQLDLASASVYGVKTEMYEPFAPVTLEIEGKPDDGETTITKHYRLMSDRSEESPNGSGFYRHELLLIEETKYLEGFMVESLCVTNAGGREDIQITPQIYNESGDLSIHNRIIGLDNGNFSVGKGSRNYPSQVANMGNISDVEEEGSKKYDKTGGTIDGNVTVTGDLTVQGTTIP